MSKVWWAVALVLMLPVLAVAPWHDVRATAATETDEACGAVPRPEKSPAELRQAMADAAPLLTKAPAPPPFGFRFHRARDVRELERTVALNPGLESLPADIAPNNGDAILARASDLYDSETGRSIPKDQFSVYATIDMHEEQVGIVMCVSALTPQVISAGTYSGTVSLADPRFQTVDIPVTVTLQSRAWAVALLVVVIGGAIGGGWGVISNLVARRADPHAAVAGTQERPSPRLLLAIGLVVGLGAGAIVFVQRYASNPAFRADMGDWFTLGGTSFANAVAATYTVALTVALAFEILRRRGAQT